MTDARQVLTEKIALKVQLALNDALWCLPDVKGAARVDTNKLARIETDLTQAIVQVVDEAVYLAEKKGYDRGIQDGKKDDIKAYFREVELNDPKAKVRKDTYGLFLDIAVALTEMRMREGLSQRELAKKAKTSHPTISRWETPGYSGYTLSKLVELANVLNHNVGLRFISRGETPSNTYGCKGNGIFFDKSVPSVLKNIKGV